MNNPYNELIQMLAENKAIGFVYYTIFNNQTPKEEDLKKAYNENPVVFEKIFGYKLTNYASKKEL